MTIEKILDKAKSCTDSAEVFEQKNKKLTVSFENNKIKDSSTSDLSGVAVRVIKNGKIGFSSSSKPGDESVADFAVELAEYGKKVTFDFSDNLTSKAFDVDLGSFDSLDENTCVLECEKAMNEIRSLHKDLLAMSQIVREFTESHVLTSKGLDLVQRLIRITWHCGFNYNTEGNFLTCYDFRIGNKFNGFGDLISKVKEDYAVCKNNEAIPGGKYRVLFSPRAFTHLMMVFGYCLSGFGVAKKISPWSGKIGEKLFDKRITILTDLVSKDSVYRKAIDDEGTPTGKLTLIDKGVLKSFYHTRDTASQCGHSPTGHACRMRYSAMPMPSIDGMVLAPGKDDTQDMKSQSDIWVDDLMGAMMSNPYSGIISGNISMGYIMENGKRRARIKDAVLSINVFDAFKNNIIAISKETARYGFPGIFNLYDAPWLLLDNISVSA